jgi:cysteine synthase
MAIYSSIINTIGKTPIVKINNLTGENDGNIFVKCEFFNPGSSVKDRIALSMIEDAEKNGLLKEGSTIVEPTSGNTGIGLALVAAAKKYKVILTMPETMSIERRMMLKILGAEIVLTPGPKGMTGAVEKAKELSKEHGYFMPQQFDNSANPKIHRETTALEILNDFNEIGLDYFVAGVGTGGTISGVSEILKANFKTLKVIAVEPAGSPVLSGGLPGPHKIQGIGAGFIPKNYNPSLVDEIIQVSNDEAIETAKKLIKNEGVLGGISSGAAMSAALKIAANKKGKNILTILPDTTERYLSTDLFKEFRDV